MYAAFYYHQVYDFGNLAIVINLTSSEKKKKKERMNL